jgi:hypothetical protein
MAPSGGSVGCARVVNGTANGASPRAALVMRGVECKRCATPNLLIVRPLARSIRVTVEHRCDTAARRATAPRGRDPVTVEPTVRPIELLASGLKLLAELLQVLHLEPDVVQTATSGSSRSGVSLPEIHDQAWQLCEVNLRGRAGQQFRPCPERLHISITCFGWRHRPEVEAFHPDRRFLRRRRVAEAFIVTKPGSDDARTGRPQSAADGLR